MSNFETTDQFKVFSHPDISAYNVREPLLVACIGYSNKFPEYSCIVGFNSRKDFGYALLAYFTSIALDIHRMPFCEDRIYNNFHIAYCTEEHKNVLRSLNHEKLKEICNEINELYSNTQDCLEKAGLSHVYLRRELRGECGDYVSRILTLKAAATILGIDNIPLDMDVLNSFGDEGGYESSVSLELKIPAKDIFYCHKLIESRHPDVSYWLVEPGEWVVINRSPTGIVDIPVSDILIRESNDSRKSGADGFYQKILKDMNRNTAFECFAKKHLYYSR